MNATDPNQTMGANPFCPVCATRGITVREAFAKAGHPVPPDCVEIIRFSYGEDGLYWISFWPLGDGFFCSNRFEDRGWDACYSMPLFKDRALFPNLANLPAADAYDALPQVVRDAIPADRQEGGA